MENNENMSIQEGADEEVLMQGLTETDGMSRDEQLKHHETNMLNSLKKLKDAKNRGERGREHELEANSHWNKMVQLHKLKEEENKVNLLNNIRTNSPEAKPTIKNMLFQKVGSYIGKIRSKIANESYLGENDFNVGDKVQMHSSSSTPDNLPKKTGTIHHISNTPSHKFGKRRIDVKHDDGTVTSHIGSGLTKIKEDISESAPPEMESWVKSNKKRFIDEYGEKKGLEVLYATANKMAKSKNESVNEETTHNINTKQEGDNGYVSFGHNGGEVGVYAKTKSEAHELALKHFKPSKSKSHMVHTHLAEKPDGSEVVHTPSM